MERERGEERRGKERRGEEKTSARLREREIERERSMREK
jgi:hypothetical protein